MEIDGHVASQEKRRELLVGAANRLPTRGTVQKKKNVILHIVRRTAKGDAHRGVHFSALKKGKKKLREREEV